ncbi:MAG: succinylglutamate desuccinylase/aspartoacylase family protein [Betaproteobacteria bacterium]
MSPGAAANAPAIEVEFPDLSAYAAGNTGVPFVWTYASEHPGPHVVVQALTHGNEVCGAIAIDALMREGLRPIRGTLSWVFANVAAYLRFDAASPFASRCVDEDFNRLWTAAVLDGPRESVELTRARALRPLYERCDCLLDLHSMSDPCPPLAMAGPQAKGLALARAIATPPHVIVDRGHASGRRLRDYAFFDDPVDPRNALLIECGQHWESSAPAVARDAILRMLDHLDMLDTARSRALAPAAGPQHVIEVTTTVTITSDDFRFVVPVQGLQTIASAGSVYAIDGGTPIQTPHDDSVLIMPTRRPKRGETAVRIGRYVE